MSLLPSSDQSHVRNISTALHQRFSAHKGPIAIVAYMSLLLLVLIIKRRRSELPLWKSSNLALLIHNLGRPEDGTQASIAALHQAESIRQRDQIAHDIRVVLKKTDNGISQFAIVGSRSGGNE